MEFSLFGSSLTERVNGEWVFQPEVVDLMGNRDLGKM